MVKLLKHELHAIFRTLLLFALAAVLFAVAARISVDAALRTDSGELGWAFIIMFILYTVALAALLVAAWAIGVSRFYKSLFTGEGYMTFSLPVTSMQIVWAKLLSSIIAMFFAAIVVVLSYLILFMSWGGEFDYFELVGNYFGELFQYFRTMVTQSPLLFAENILYVIFSLPMSLLVVYACISVGQLSTSHRKGLTFLLVIGVYFGYSIIYSLFIEPAIASIAMGPDHLIEETAYELSQHVKIWVDIGIAVIADVGSFFIIRYILKNKVNLVA